MSITERIGRLMSEKKVATAIRNSDPLHPELPDEIRYANFLDRIPDLVREQHQLFGELRATGLIGMIQEVAHSIYIEPESSPYYEEYIDALRQGKKGVERDELTSAQIEELQSNNLDWVAQTLRALDMRPDGTPDSNGLEISLMRVSKSGFVTIEYDKSRGLKIRGANTTFNQRINVSNANEKLKRKLENSLARAIVNPYEGRI